MSKRSDEKRVTKATRAIKFLRDQANMSLREAAQASGLNLSVIAHLETGRIGVGEKHLELLLPVGLRAFCQSFCDLVDFHRAAYVLIF
jgi:transcriptional regulator with XRE-family HTH domain